jgi:hypothetical protein
LHLLPLQCKQCTRSRNARWWALSERDMAVHGDHI